MKRIFPLLIALVCAFTIHAKHLEFMNIPINGTINVFQSKLAAKGFSLHKYNNTLPDGQRAFVGTFAGRKCTVFGYYNPKTKVVYGVAVSTNGDNTYEGAQNVLDSFRNMLIKKYAGKYEEVYSDEESFCINVFDGQQEIGTITLQIIQTGEYLPVYEAAITYSDNINYQKFENSLMDDF